MKNSFFLSILCLMLAVLAVAPQSTMAQTAQISIDSNNVEFGCPVRMQIRAKAKIGQNVVPPAFKNNMVVPQLEILSMDGTDTLVTGTQDVTYTFKYSITSFEDSTFVIPKQPVIIDRDTFYTNEKAVTFTLLQNIDSSFYAGIDTTQSLRIFDMKPLKETPFTFEEFWERFGKIILFLIIFAAIVSLITYVVVRKIKNQPIIPFSKPKEPAHKQALLMLGGIREMKLCEEGKYKEYYTYITEILKKYISERWGTSVLESSSTETIAILKKKVGAKSEALQMMKDITETADFVKFAKMEPEPEKNQKMLDMAFSIVNTTKQTEQEILEEEKVEPTLSFIEAVKLTLGKNYFNFKSRARRSEYWWFKLAYNGLIFVLMLMLRLIDNMTAVNILVGLLIIVWLAGAVPMMGASIRRMHDKGKSGWYYLLAYIPAVGEIIFALLSITDSQRGANKWGLSPKYPNSRNTEFLNEN